MQHATHALLNVDLTVAEEVLGRHDELTYRCAQVETDAFTILALQSPVAGDLRAVLSALKNVADAERMGVLARHVAKIARRRHPRPAVPTGQQPCRRYGPHRCPHRQRHHTRGARQ